MFMIFLRYLILCQLIVIYFLAIKIEDIKYLETFGVTRFSLDMIFSAYTNGPQNGNGINHIFYYIFHKIDINHLHLHTKC